MEVKEGKRFDQNKVDLSLVPPELDWFFAGPGTHGLRDHERDNYLKGMDWSRVLASLKRHLSKWQGGEICDDDSGLPHLHHVVWNAAVLALYEHRGIGNDNVHTFPGRVDDCVKIWDDRENMKGEQK